MKSRFNYSTLLETHFIDLWLPEGMEAICKRQNLDSPELTFQRLPQKPKHFPHSLLIPHLSDSQPTFFACSVIVFLEQPYTNLDNSQKLASWEDLIKNVT